MRRCRSIWLGLAVLVSGPGLAAAQQQLSPRWEIPGLDFHPNGVWRVRARSIARARAALLGRRDFSSLNAPLEGALAVSGAPAVTGTLFVPAILLRYKDTNPATLRDTAQYSAVLFGATPPAGRPYTVRTYYEELSRGLFSMQGRVLGWAALDSNEATYTGPAGGCFGNPFGTSNCNGIFSVGAIASMQNGMAEALAKIDSASAIDWGQFDNDGPDGIPNSSDDDGYVDMAIFVHPAQDGACGGSTNNHIWSHRFQLLTPYVTKTPAHNGGFIKIRDYTFQSGVGGSTACDTSQIMPAGTAAHESGHGLGLPDLYDLSFVTEGIGEWGIMGSGNYATPLSPARMEAWSLGELGWVTLAPVTVGGTYTLGPSPQSDSAFVVRPTGANPRGEYFLVENRQRLGSDSAMIRLHCARSNNPPGCGGGLFIWHVDSVIAADNGFRQNNQMNSLAIHGLALEEADGLRQLWCGPFGCNRGDGGDPYPGTSGNTLFSLRTRPSATLNQDSSFAGFAIDSVRQLVPNGGMSFRLRVGQLTVVAANDTNALITVDSVDQNVFRDLLVDGSSHTIAVLDTQYSGAGTRYVFQSWSDGLPISHTITGSAAGTTYTATLARARQLSAWSDGNGAIAFNPPADSNLVYVAEGTPVTLTATAIAPAVFRGWIGDTNTSNRVVVLPMARPYSVIAVFDPQLVINTTGPLPSGEVGNAYVDSLSATGGDATRRAWSVASGTLPPGLALRVDGWITGTPASTGKFVFTLRLTSQPQQALLRDSITITAPDLALRTVLAQLTTGTTTLSATDVAYLDYLGNQNGRFDVGDFLAWVRFLGLTPASPAVQQALVALRRRNRS